jgi:hypothetical protein
MTIEDIKETEFYKSRPEIIQKAIEARPFNQLYRIRDTGHECFIFSYDEPTSGKFEDITLTVEKTGNGGALADLGAGELDKGWQVFGLSLDDIAPATT